MVFGALVVRAGVVCCLLAVFKSKCVFHESKGTGIGIAGRNGQQIGSKFEESVGVIEAEIAVVDIHQPAIDILGNVQSLVSERICVKL